MTREQAAHVARLEDHLSILLGACGRLPPAHRERQYTPVTQIDLANVHLAVELVRRERALAAQRAETEPPDAE